MPVSILYFPVDVAAGKLRGCYGWLQRGRRQLATSYCCKPPWLPMLSCRDIFKDAERRGRPNFPTRRAAHAVRPPPVFGDKGLELPVANGLGVFAYQHNTPIPSATEACSTISVSWMPCVYRF